MEADDRVRAYVSDAVDGCSADRITAVRRFDTGERHAVYKVSYLDDRDRATDVVARIALGATDCAGARLEAAVLRLVGGIAAPRLYDFRCRSSWFETPSICMQFVPGRQQDMATAPPTDIEHLGAIVAGVHRLPLGDLVEHFPTASGRTYLDERWESVEHKLPSIRDPLPPTVQRRLHAAWGTVEQRLAAAGPALGAEGYDGRPALLHGDVAAGNVIWGADPVLIDWEYARLGDPADEIAYIFGQNDLTVSQRDAFWRGYRGAAAPERLEGVADRARRWEPVNLLGSALWWIERWSHRVDADVAGRVAPAAPKPASHYLDQALRRLVRLERLLHVDEDGGEADRTGDPA